ncbi:hypothetical protein FRC0537_01879 [Corynebacterium diphtheriae]|nr:hypothetical protein FRC0537_01879 [Corynebacterium diphtheriae]
MAMSPSSKPSPSSPSSPSMNAPRAGSQENHEQAPQRHLRLHPTHKQCTLTPEEPPNGGISKDFSQNFTPNRFQTGRLSRFGVKCRLFGGERGVARPPTPTNAHQHPTQNQCTLKTEEPVCCINSTNQNYGFGMLRRLDFAISTMWPTPPPKTVRVAAREKPINISIVMFGGIDKALGSVMMSISTGPS